MSIGCAALMCHAPIVVPPIAGSRAADCKTTTRAMGELARTLLAHEPDLIVLVSPHAPRRPHSWGIAHGERLWGSFARFGHPELVYAFAGDGEAAGSLAREALQLGLETHEIDGRALDHGALVPLHFVHEAGYTGPILLVALPFPGTETEQTFGEAVANASRRLGKRWALLASGDMSHRLTRDAPAGFDPAGRDFDHLFVAHLRRGDVGAAVSIDAQLAELAAEDVLQSTEVALGAVGQPHGTEVLSYEGPFGVGYCEALLHTDRVLHEVPGQAPPTRLAELALEAIRAELLGQRFEPPALAAPWDVARPVFVTLRSPDGELRGCIGRVDPVQATLASEVADCAVSAASRDYRMPPVEVGELDALHIEVSVLSTPEPVAGPAELDPQRYGVVVSRGSRRGVLLPNVEGIDTAEEQLRVALRKGGIAPGEEHRIERFTVKKAVLGKHGAA
jgi:AmmeMemoRadiSam system protein A